jgi:phosphatidylinositol dimannoside acyltransferase
MGINLGRVMNSPAALNFVTGVVRLMPRRAGYVLANGVGKWLASRRDSPQLKAIRTNQWVISGMKSGPAELDQAVREVYCYSARSVFEVYHYLRHPYKMERLYVLEESFKWVAARPEMSERGLVAVGMHLAGFDLGLQWLCMTAFKPLVLTIPDPQGARGVEFERRRKTGMHIMPGSFEGVRQGIQFLKEGGIVVTGIDRPMPQGDPKPLFFGQPAIVPVHHVYMAQKARVPVVVVVSRMEKDGKYHIHASEPIEMDSHPDRKEELRLNAEKVLKAGENFIRQTPHQWIVPLPVWPELIKDVP